MERRIHDLLNGAPDQPHDAAAVPPFGTSSSGSSNNYVMSLLSRAQPALVQQVLSWQAEDWHRFLIESASSVSLLVQLATRSSDASLKLQHELLADQQLCEAVDHIVTVGAIGAIYGERTGPQLGICTATNHITGVQEAPQQQHWHQVLQQLQLSQPQMLKLSACFEEFTRQRKAHGQLQAVVASATACSNSCSLQLLAASPSGLNAGQQRPRSLPPDVGGAAAAAATAAASQTLSADSRRPQQPQPPPCGSGGSSSSTPDPSQLMTQLLAMVNRSFSMMFLVLHNTLTRQQIAQMLVASFPFVPRAAPIMEAASQALAQASAAAHLAMTPDAADADEWDDADADGEDAGMQEADED